MSARTPDELELRNRLFAAPGLKPQDRRAILLLFAALMIVAMFLFFQLSDATSATDWAARLRQLRERIAGEPLGALLLPVALVVLSALQIGYFVLARARERLILTQSGMEYRSPLPGPLEALRPGWTLRWDEVSRARLLRRRYMSGPMAVQIELATLRATRRLAPWQWIDPRAIESVPPGEMLRDSRTLSGSEALDAVLDSPLMRFATARLPRLETAAARAEDAGAYALERSPRAIALVAVLFALIAYAITETVVIDDVYAGDPPWDVFFAGGVLGAGLAWIWMRAGEVPALERSAVALLVGVALGCALHPGLLRVNAATDPDGPRTYAYRLLEDRTLAPPETGLPRLDFTRYPEYWSQFEPGSRHEIVLRRGALDFYQVDMAPLRAAMRAFYEKQP